MTFYRVEWTHVLCHGIELLEEQQRRGADHCEVLKRLHQEKQSLLELMSGMQAEIILHLKSFGEPLPWVVKRWGWHSSSALNITGLIEKHDVLEGCYICRGSCYGEESACLRRSLGLAARMQ
jgi:hypothetical protein